MTFDSDTKSNLLTEFLNLLWVIINIENIPEKVKEWALSDADDFLQLKFWENSTGYNRKPDYF